MAVDFKSVEQLFIWNKKILSFGGLWPLEPAFVKFYIGFAYYSSHMFIGINDLIGIFGDLPLMIMNLMEMTAVRVIMVFKLLILRHSGKLRKVLERVEDGANEKNYRDDAEKQIYISHNVIGKTVFKIVAYFGFSTCFLHGISPLTDILSAVLRNETVPLALPYEMRIFLGISDIRTYTLLYICQCPIYYFSFCYTITICFFFTLIVHVTGEMSILAHRIRLIGKSSDSSNHDNWKVEFRDIVSKHYDIIWIATTIDDIFNVVLLEELSILTVLVGLTIYSLLSTDLSESMYNILFFGTYSVAQLLVILLYCIAGENLISESTKIYDAYYECEWYEMSNEYKKQLIICMSRAQKPLQLTAGKFYVFSLPRFSDILKTAMAYISMLRTVV